MEGSPAEGERCTIVSTPALFPFVWLPMRSPPAAKTVFVAWDHSVDEHQAELPTLIRGAGTHHTYTARCAGGEDPDGPISEDLCTDIRQTDCLLAFLERPNCNVMFEAGFALGVGKPIYLRVYSEQADHRWTEAAKWLKGLPVRPLEDAAEDVNNFLRYDACVAGKGYTPPTPTAAAGKRPAILTLCPHRNPGRTARESIERHLADLMVLNRLDGSLTNQLQAIDHAEAVGWVIPFLTLDSRHRDHPENAANAFLAGYARGTGKTLKLFQQTGVRLRTLLDIIDLPDHPWLNVNDLPDVIRRAW